MGKYSALEQDDLATLQAHGVIAIANELAEANRLKRIEVKHLVGKDCNIMFNIDIKDLEDKA